MHAVPMVYAIRKAAAGKLVSMASPRPRKPLALVYAVAVGRVPGLYDCWADAQPQISGFPRSRFKKFVRRPLGCQD